MENSLAYLFIIEAIVLVIFAIIIGNIGSKRTIGFTTAFLLSIFLTPIVGYLFVHASSMKSNAEYEDSEEESDDDIEFLNVNDVGYSDVGYSNFGFDNNNVGFDKNSVGFTGKNIIKNIIPKLPEKRDLKHKLSKIIHKLKVDHENRKCKDFL
jgi:hypothetical protein